MCRDCPKRALICFHCNQISHKKVDCPRLSGVEVVGPTPAPLRITSGLHGKAEAPLVKSRAFQLATDEACAAPDVVTSMCFNLIFYRFLVYAYAYYDLV